MAHQKFAEQIGALNRCADTCDHCAVGCLDESNVAEMSRCIRLDIDCAALCRFTAGALARGSECADVIARLCAEVCDACGQECAKHEHEHCKACAAACEECAKSCRGIAA